MGLAFRYVAWNKIPKLATFIRCNASVATGSQQATLDDLAEIEYSKAKPFNDIPGIRSLPLIGSLWVFLPVIGKYDFGKFVGSSADIYKEFGSVTRFDLSTFNKFLWIYELDDMKKVLLQEGKWPERPILGSLRKVLKSKKMKAKLPHEGLLSTNGLDWYTLRSQVQPHLMKPRTVVNYLKGMDGVGNEFADRIGYLRDEKKEVSNLLDEINKWALESLALVALDTHMGCLHRNVKPGSDSEKLISSAVGLFELITNLEISVNQMWRFFPTKTYRKLEENVTKFTDISLKYLQQAKERLNSKQASSNNDFTFLEQLILQKTDDDLIAVMIRDMMLAGIDTTSITAGFFLYCMAKNPEVQQKAHEEIIGLVPTLESPITQDVLNNVRYTKACLKESMRMFPITTGFVRKTVEDTVLSGYQVPKNTQIFVQMGTAYKLEKNFKDPESFIPERWLKSETSAEKPDAYSFLPFGHGVRSCVGRRIVEQELYTLFIRVLQRYRVEYHHEDIGMRARIIACPDKPLRLEFNDRF